MADIKPKKKKEESMDLAAQASAAQEAVNRFGSAEKEFLVSFSGVDNETGKILTRGLDQIGSSKVHPEYKNSNIKQQGGYSAEVIYAAKQNAENIISGKSERFSRTDDIGRVNDPLYDHVLLRKDGTVIFGSGEQMKFVGGNPKECLTQLASKSFQKYLDADVRINIPSDFYDGVLSEADKSLASFRRQLEKAQKEGRIDLVKKHQQRIDKYEKIKSSVKNCGVTNAQALRARLHPKLTVAMEVSKLSHRAGLEQSQIGAAVAGAFSLTRNLVSVVKGDISAGRAAQNVVKETGIGAIAGYAVAFSGSALKAVMQNARKSTIRSLSKTNAPAIVVTSAVDVGQSITSYIRGNITGPDCLVELGEKGVANTFAAVYGMVGQSIIPIPVFGALVGSTLGYFLSSYILKELKQKKKDAKEAKERREALKAECAEATRLIESYRADLELAVHHYLQSNSEVFLQALTGMDQALVDGDIDKFISSANSITRKLGKKPQFETLEEFGLKMNSNNAFEL